MKEQTLEEKSEVRKTQDYSLFKGLVGNRGINKPHVARLRRSFEKRNLLKYYPILVDKNMNIIDGQHRLLAAQELNVPIYYQVVEKAGLQEVQLLNANNRAWGTQDYLDSYVAMGKGEYITLQEFANEYRLSVSISILILSDEFYENHSLMKQFREGKFTIKDYSEAENLASLINEVRHYSPDNAWADRDCIRALRILMDKVDPKLLIEQLKRYSLIVTRRVNVKDYLREFENIVNQNREEKPVYLTA